MYVYVSEVPTAVLVLKMEAEDEHATSSTSSQLDEARTMDQVLQSQKSSHPQQTWGPETVSVVDVNANDKILLLPVNCRDFLPPDKFVRLANRSTNE